ncbi:IPT/TIG domain-containing protein [Coprobacter sp.]
MKKLRSFKLTSSLCAVLLIFVFASCKDDKEKSTTHDPNKPISLTNFYPTNGGVATKLILNGDNFGSDAKNIKVFINDKPAAVISSIGNKIYAICPRKPGEGDENQIIDCKVKVKIGNQEVEYPEHFTYQIQTVVTTVCGVKDAPDDVVTGNLAQTTMPPVTYLAVDNNNNIFACLRNRDSYYNNNKVILVNEDEDASRLLIPDTGAPLNQPCMLDDGKTVYIPSDGGLDYWTMSSENMWSPMKQALKPATGEQVRIEYKHAFAMCTIDGYMYVRAKDGNLYKFNPQTGLTNHVKSDLMSGSDSYIAFSQKSPSKLYLAYTNSHCVYTYDVLTGKHEAFAGIAGQPGYLDGIGSYAMFNTPRQLILDEDDNLYIADTENHVIRKVTPEGQVSTVIGQPGVAGYQDGDPEVAMFNRPYGVCINKEGIIYIGDHENQCIRRLAIE